MKHLEADHGVVPSGLERGQLPIVVDSPQSSSSQMVWVVNTILGDLVANHTISDVTTLRRAKKVAKERIE
jgi:hypothetical protein